MWSVTAFAKNAGDSSLLVGNCDEKNECAVNVSASDPRWARLCDSSDLSVHWAKGLGRYLIQCRSGGTSEENVVWLIDLKAEFFGKLYFGRFFKKSALEAEPDMKIQDKFQSRELCNSVDLLKIEASDFVLLDKKPTNDAESPYCYDPVYLVLQGGRLTIGNNSGPFKDNDADHAVHEVLSRDEARLRHLLDVARRWDSEP